LLDATLHVYVGVTFASFEYITDCIICIECDLDISTVEKICKFSYHWVPVSESDPYLGVWKVYLLCEGGNVSSYVIVTLGSNQLDTQ